MSGPRIVPPDQPRRDLILSELDRCMLVEAAAGTGKTASIVARMVELLKKGRCEEIRNMAAVTFTRKAAAELRSRFQIALEKAVREAGGEELERLSRALANIEQCFIGTIHSFCGRLLRERPVEAGVDIAFEEIDEDADAALRDETWLDYCARLIADDPGGKLAELNRLGVRLTDLDEAFRRYALYPDVDRWPLPSDGHELDHLEEAVAELEAYVRHMREIEPDLPEKTGSDQLIGKYRSIPRIVSHYEDLHDPRQLMEVLEQRFDRGSGETQKVWASEGKFTAAEAKAEGQRWNDFRERVTKPLLSAWRQTRYQPVMLVLAGARELYDAARAERGQLNFQDLLMKAAELLRGNPHVRRYFNERFTHLLVDEFQDTDPIQAEVMLLLTADDFTENDWRCCQPRPGSLFVVGDPKQSIYRFRRADIVTYKEVKEIILVPGDDREPGALVQLSTNFRTVAPLIEWVNGTFETGDGPQEMGDAKTMLRFPASECEESPAYVTLQAGRLEGTPGEFSGVYTLLVGEDAGGRDEAVTYEADVIARFMRRAIDSGMTVPRTADQLAQGRRPEVDASDFMLITRYRKHLSVYAGKLQEYGVPFQVTGGTALNQVSELKLLWICLQAVARPDDPVALIGALRSEAFGISDVTLFRFKEAGGRFDYNAPVPDTVPPDDRDALADTFERLKRYRRWLSALPAVSAIENVVADLGLMVLACAHPGGDVQAGSLAKAIELLRGAQNGNWATVQLVEYLGNIIDIQQKHDGISARSEEQPMVRVMNLHKVKGLEAPVVFLANAYGEGSHGVEMFIDRSGKEVLGYMAVHRKSSGWGPGPLLAHPQDWAGLAEREKAFARAEDLRLRYVAATRAGSAMVVTQRPLPKLNSRNAWRHFYPLLPAADLIEEPGEQKAPERARVPISAEETLAALAGVESRLAAAETATYDARRAKEYAIASASADGGLERATHEAPDTLEGEPSGTNQGEFGVEWGQAIHQLLELVMTSPEADLVSWAQTMLEENGVDASHATSAAETVRSVMSSDIWARARASDRRMTEVPFTIALDDTTLPTIIRGAIDLAFAVPGGWVLVDFKTDTVGATDDVDALATRYAPQIKLYARAWELCTGEKVIEAGLYFIRADRFEAVAL